jgi:hypothetical protein
MISITISTTIDMSNYATLIAAIQSVITENGNNEITGTILQQTLLSMINSLGIGYQFVGIATPDTIPGTPDQRVFFIASSGTYPNFGPAVIPDGKLAVFYYDTSWHNATCDVTAVFQTGQSVTQIAIDNTHLANPKDGALPTANDVLQLKAKLDGVTASEVKVNAVVGANVTAGAYVSGGTGLLVTPGSSASSYSYFETAIPQGTKSIRFATGTKTSGAQIGYSIGYYDNGTYVPTRCFYFDVAETTPPTGIVEKVIEVLDGETTFRATVAAVSAYASITLDDFYCYLQSGKNVVDLIPNVEDRLDSDSPTDALSAKQGKLIAETTMQLKGSLNILSPANILNYRIGRNGGLLSIGSNTQFYGCTDYIEIGDGVICNHSLGRTGNLNCGGAVYDSNKLFIGYFSTISGNNGDPAVVNENTTLHGTPGSGADTTDRHYVRFNLYNPTSVSGGVPYDGVTDGYAVYKGNTLPSSFQPWIEPHWEPKDANIPNDSITTEKLADDAVTIEKVNFKTVEVGKNKLNPNNVQANKAVNYTNGNIVSATGRYATDYIKVSKLGLYLNHAPVSPGNVNMGYAVYGAAPSYPYIRGGAATSSGTATYLYEEGDEYVRFTVSSINNAYIIEGTSPGEYEPYEEKKVIDPHYLPSANLSDEEIEQVKAELANDKFFTDKLDVLLPQRFYCVKGDTLQLFYKGMVKAIDLANRYVKPTCSVGTPYHRYMEIPSNTTAAVGDRGLSVTIYDDNENILGSGTSVIRIVNAPQSPASEKHVLCLGASTTAGGKWPCECQRRLLASDGTPQGKGLTNIRFVGSLSQTLYGQTTHFFAKSGWSWYDYCTEGRGARSFRFYLSGSNNDVNIGNIYSNNSYSYTVVEINTIDGVDTILCETSSASNLPQSSGTLTPTSGAEYPSLTYSSYEQDSANPFWDSINDKLAFKPYVDAYCDGSIDIVYILLAANRLFTDSVETTKGYIRTFVEQLHTEYPNCIVVLAASMYPSMINMMPGYGASGNTTSNTYKTLCKEFALFSMYKELADEYEYVEFESWSAQSDSDYNYPLTMKNVNTRNSTKQEPYANNTVHPGDTGYMQYADAAYRSIVAHFCQ